VNSTGEGAEGVCFRLNRERDLKFVAVAIRHPKEDVRCDCEEFDGLPGSRA